MITDIELVEPLPGLSARTSFVLDPLDANGHLFALRGTGGDPTRLFLMRPEPYFQEYSPTLDPALLAALRLDADDARCAVLVIVTPRSGDAPATANLLAPLVLNTATGRAQQVILDGASWPLRAPLVAA